VDIRVAKLFKNGASQAVRLPAEFRFEGDEVYIAKNEVTGDVVLSSRPSSTAWVDFFQLLHAIDVPKEFMLDRPMNSPPQERCLLEDQNQ
jgi:antitoxin VapB